MATETVRSRVNGTPSVTPGFGADADEVAEEMFEELTVVDAAGRLQIPKDYLLKFGIRGRARLRDDRGWDPRAARRQR